MPFKHRHWRRFGLAAEQILLEQEVQRSSWNVQRFLLLAGLVWLSLGVGAFVTLSAMLARPTAITEGIPQGMQWIGLGLACIGLSHLAVYLVGKKKGELGL